MKAILPLILWLALITFLLLMPMNDLDINHFAFTDKLVHVFLFGVTTVLILNIRKQKVGLAGYLIAVLMSSIYGFFIECLQDSLNTGRYFDNFDIIANIIGSLIGSIIFYFIRKLKSKWVILN